MDEKELSYKRRCAVQKAWNKEREQVGNAKGSRDWSKKEQREILKAGRCHGYDGHHMLSVKKHPEHAGNPDNIQFLTRKEHYQAHGGNWKNDANGRYNTATQKVEPLKGNKPVSEYKAISKPLSEQERKKYNRLVSSRSVSNTKKRTSGRKLLRVNKSSTDGSGDKSDKAKSLFNSRRYDSAKSTKAQSKLTASKSVSKSMSKSNGQKM